MNEEFDKYWNNLNRHYPFRDDYQSDIDIKDAYLAGAAAMREKCAEVAEGDDTYECSCSSDYECKHCATKKNIAAAIRKMEVE